TLQEGPPAELLARPRDPLVARLVDQRNLFEAEVAGHDSTAGVTRLAWLGYTLEAAHRPEFPAGSRIVWMVPPGGVVMHRRDRPSRGERENPIAGTVDEIVALGESLSVVMAMSGAARLSFSVPR